MTVKKTVTSLKGLVKKPAKPVTVAMMNEAVMGHMVKEYQLKIDRKPSYKLADLLAQSDPNAPIPEDIKWLLEIKPVGKELL